MSDNNTNIIDYKDLQSKKGPGRPLGYKLSESTKTKIRNVRKGSKHSEETKKKISRSLLKYFGTKDSLYNNMKKDYKNFPEKILSWLSNNKEDLDKISNVMTERKLYFLNQLELCFGSDIDRFSHSQTPEFLLMLKEELKELGLKRELEQMNLLLGEEDE
jgi:hypothetical protein